MTEQRGKKGNPDAVPHIALDFTYLLQSFRYSLTKFLTDTAASQGSPYDADPHGRPWWRLLHANHRVIVWSHDRDGWQDETWNAVQADDPEEQTPDEHEPLTYLPNPPNLTSGRWDDVERFENLDKGATLEQWVPLFIADVQKVVNRQKDNDGLGEHFHSLVKAVEGWRVPRLCDGNFAINDAPKYAIEIQNVILDRVKALSKSQVVPAPSPTFRELLGDENLATTLAVIHDLGYRPTPTKGKAAIVACMEAALEHYRVPRPIAKYWPHMLNTQFPGIKASVKAAPPLRDRDRTALYKEARTAMLDRLKG